MNLNTTHLVNGARILPMVPILGGDGGVQAVVWCVRNLKNTPAGECGARS